MELLEHNGARRGDISISLTSPRGTKSILLPHRPRDFVNTDSLTWSFMSVLNWGEYPVGEWIMSMSFISGEGYVNVSELTMTLFGIADTSVVSASQNCSSECRGGCAREGADYCDTCSGYRDAETLTCLNSCSETSHTEYRSYCMPLKVTESSVHIIGHHRSTTASVQVVQRGTKFNSLTVAPTLSAVSGFTGSGCPSALSKHLHGTEKLDQYMTSYVWHTATAHSTDHMASTEATSPHCCQHSLRTASRLPLYHPTQAVSPSSTTTHTVEVTPHSPLLESSHHAPVSSTSSASTISAYSAIPTARASPTSYTVETEQETNVMISGSSDTYTFCICLYLNSIFLLIFN